MGNCLSCVHCIYDGLWGEYKCKARQHRLYILLDQTECNQYKQKPKEKKGS